MTTRFYYDDPDGLAFDATVIRVEPKGVRQAIWLDGSAFYPTTGGQPFDTGTLDAAHVIDVFEDDDGDVVHLVEGGPALSIGQRVHGVVDGPRRFDHMQQHTGQHVLSAAILRHAGVKTVSFHLGAELSTIDLARELASEEIARAEDEANRFVWEDRPVSIRYASAEEASAMPLRKPSARAGTLRLIDIDGVDLSACGGTHVTRTGAIGVIAIDAWERFKGGQRIAFRCGGRALAQARALRDIVASCDRLLSVTGGQLPTAVQRLLDEAKEQKRVMTGLQSELAGHRALALRSTAETTPNGRLVFQAVDADAAALKALAAAVVSQPGFLAVLVSPTPPALVVAARSDALTVSCHEIVTALTRRFGGRGGGRPELAQGGGLTGDSGAILDQVRRLLSVTQVIG